MTAPKTCTQLAHIPDWALRCYGDCEVSPDDITVWRDSWHYGRPAPQPEGECPECGEDFLDPYDGGGAA